MQKKTVWAGVQSGQIRFFSSDPEGNVEGLQGSRKFTVTGQNAGLVDDNGNNLIDSTSADLGSDNAGTIEQSSDNNGPTGGAAQGQHQQGGQQTA